MISLYFVHNSGWTPELPTIDFTHHASRLPWKTVSCVSNCYFHLYSCSGGGPPREVRSTLPNYESEKQNQRTFKCNLLQRKRQQILRFKTFKRHMGKMNWHKINVKRPVKHKHKVFMLRNHLLLQSNPKRMCFAPLSLSRSRSFFTFPSTFTSTSLSRSRSRRSHRSRRSRRSHRSRRSFFKRLSHVSCLSHVLQLSLLSQLSRVSQFSRLHDFHDFHGIHDFPCQNIVKHTRILSCTAKRRQWLQK